MRWVYYPHNYSIVVDLVGVFYDDNTVKPHSHLGSDGFRYIGGGKGGAMAPSKFQGPPLQFNFCNRKIFNFKSGPPTFSNFLRQ